MTLYLIDIASYQRGINLDKVRGSGFSIVNVKTSQGVNYTFGDAGMYAREAHARGMALSCFHWLDNSASGGDQAAYCWRTLGPIVRECGPVALQVDNEDSKRPATWAITRDFVHAIADRLGHLPYMYTGDWWATSGGRSGWDVHSLTPWLMAAPNVGYLGGYPGDASSHWRAGYWGYANLSLMQYNVGPIAGAGGGNISKTAIRDHAVWAALTGQTPAQPSAPRGHGDDEMGYLAVRAATDDEPEQVYHVVGGLSHPVDSDKLIHLAYLSQEGLYPFLNAPPAHVDEWEARKLDNGLTVYIRRGWSAETFGQVYQDRAAVVIDASTVESLASAIVAKLPAAAEITAKTVKEGTLLAFKEIGANVP